MLRENKRKLFLSSAVILLPVLFGRWLFSVCRWRICLCTFSACA